jgi:hypothetical protein
LPNALSIACRLLAGFHRTILKVAAARIALKKEPIEH